ncbi:MAG: C4-dicarboxylic acid transporter DauA [Phycisphaerales bacterium]|nr:C4-dicarboxylic acid transporter DauA [Phycisphaerales bacterium]
MHRQNLAEASAPRTFPLAVALRRTLSLGYRPRDLLADLSAGCVVGVIALPLSMALAVASGVAPQHGLYTAIIAGAIIALLGGSKVQVSGPTAAFVVILAPIAAKFGLGGLLIATVLAGIMLMLLGMSRMGRLIEFIPFPVTTGFTTGIAVVIATLQINDFLGLGIAKMPEHYWDKIRLLATNIAGLAHAWPTWPNFAIGGLTLAILLILPRVAPKIPAPIVALPAGAIAAAVLHRFLPWFDVATIRSKYPATDGIPQVPPTLSWPWNAPDAAGAPIGEALLDFGTFEQLLIAAFAIAMLGAIESLLSAVVADGMTGKKHDPDAELVAQGVGNIVAPFFGGFAATGAIARTATNIRYGARSPLAAVVHAIFILIAILAAAEWLGYLPLASLAAMLLIVARNMSELKHFAHVLRVAPRSDIVVMLTCFGLTVLFDMVIAVSAGVVLAAVLFMGRMAAAAEVKLVGEEHPDIDQPLPKGVRIYQVAGPLFFGAANRAMGALKAIAGDVKMLILDLRAVPTMDATALVALESSLDRLHQQRIFVVIAGVQDQPLHLMAKAGWKKRPWLIVWRSFDDGVALARSLAESDFDSAGELTHL